MEEYTPNPRWSKDYERREKIVRVRADDVLNTFNALATTAHYVRLPHFPQLPKGYRVVAVQMDFYSTCFDFMVYHPSWNIVPDGAHAPFFLGKELVSVPAAVFVQVDYSQQFADEAIVVRDD
jgi:hypothetical protein